jgi:PleD family two-component response regulator
MAYILCVDDEESIASLLRQVLKMAGHEVALARNGFEALDSIAEREPDLVVLDRSMPIMDGIEVCRAIKSNPFLSRVPVLMLTALAAVDFKIEGFEAGADDYLSKPFEPRELTARVSALLRLVAREGDRNPSSGLPGGRAIAHEIEGRVARGESFSVVYFDLDYFKPFADTFGFSVADEVITGTGALLGEIAGEHGDFVGHIGGDDFLLVCSSERAQTYAEAGATRFAQVVKKSVSGEIFAKGQFTGLNRDGEPQEFPLAQLTAVIVPVDPEHWISVSHLGEAAATWKKAAKARGEGGVIVAEI